MAKVYDVVAVTGKYTNKKGEEKNEYTNCGVIIETQKGLSLKMKCYPAGGDGWYMLFEPKDESKQESSPPVDDDDDDIAF